MKIIYNGVYKRKDGKKLVDAKIVSVDYCCDEMSCNFYDDDYCGGTHTPGQIQFGNVHDDVFVSSHTKKEQMCTSVAHGWC